MGPQPRRHTRPPTEAGKIDAVTVSNVGTVAAEEKPTETPADPPVSVVDSTVSTRSVSRRPKAPETPLSHPSRDTTPEAVCDTTVAPPVDSTVSNVVSLADARRKKAVDSSVAKGKKRSVSKAEPAPKPKALKGHEWRRQGTGWTLLRSWYETENGARVRRREYVQHYSGTALRRAENLRRRLSA